MDYPRWIENIVDVCMAIQPGEKVLLITDEPMAIMRQHLTERIAAIGPAELWAHIVPDAVRPLPYYPDLLYQVAEQANVILSFEHRRDPAVETARALEMLQAVERGQARFATIIQDAEHKPHGEGARVVCELGIGTNPNARLQGNVLTDEKVMGTVHIAIGHNALESYGGQNPAPIHLDGVIGDPTLTVDGETLIENRQYLV